MARGDVADSSLALLPAWQGRGGTRAAGRAPEKPMFGVLSRRCALLTMSNRRLPLAFGHCPAVAVSGDCHSPPPLFEFEPALARERTGWFITGS